MQKEPSDVIDRLSISDLKKTRIGTEDNKKEYDALKEAFDEIEKQYFQYDWKQFYKMILDINSTIWFLESQMKGNKDLLPNPTCLDDEINNEVLIKIGKNSILIRNINSFRVLFKNIINGLTNTGFKDCKKKHMSEF